jgi:hypothetical protein
MSRTKRIYNRLRWKRAAERHWRAKYNSGSWLNWYLLDDGDPNRILTIWAGPYCYHPYKQLCMGHCSYCYGGAIRDNRTRRRKLKLEEVYYEKYWQDELD